MSIAQARPYCLSIEVNLQGFWAVSASLCDCLGLKKDLEDNS
jgi:hypothetical protein